MSPGAGRGRLGRRGPEVMESVSGSGRTSGGAPFGGVGNAVARIVLSLRLMQKTDIRLRQEIEQELRWDALTSSAGIRVSVDEGTVSLHGTVDTCAVKWAAKAATQRVSGIRGVAQHVTVKLFAAVERTDTEVAAATQSVLRSNLSVPSTVTARVENGWVILEGQTTWNYESAAAERAVSQVAGVAGVHNRIGEPPLARQGDERASAGS
jgi:osmotically-inducible protein OsmY